MLQIKNHFAHIDEKLLTTYTRYADEVMKLIPPKIIMLESALILLVRNNCIVYMFCTLRTIFAKSLCKTSIH